MKSKSKLAVVIAGCVAIAAVAVTVLHAQGIAGSNPSSNKNPAVALAEKAVLARLADIQKAAEALDPDKVFSYVLENDAGALAQNGKLFLTRTEALESTKQGFRRLQKVEYHFDQQQISMLSPTIALATGEGSTSFTVNDGRTISNRFAQSVILVLTNGEWKVFHSHRSFVPAR